MGLGTFLNSLTRFRLGGKSDVGGGQMPLWHGARVSSVTEWLTSADSGERKCMSQSFVYYELLTPHDMEHSPLCCWLPLSFLRPWSSRGLPSAFLGQLLPNINNQNLHILPLTMCAHMSLWLSPRAAFQLWPGWLRGASHSPLFRHVRALITKTPRNTIRS